ncbi:glutamate dehydrogenase [Flavobacterium sp. ZT3R18]|uniref:THC0290_0291 family protein n=1 Tax=Flavobacterium sp. ZT3R18 TaxID=2594429 RepID=UPI001179A383|nr:glutamate dehydrogenase [Flavobacterium sp. ZT3R18]TRX37996.1 glutamate dehydrogenase [Flavobacterium sp. ZT3R18]
MIKLRTLALLLLINLPYSSFSQSAIVHEIGVIIGGTEFRSDYGQRGDVTTNLNNMSFGIAIVDYMNFSYNDNSNRFFNEHFKVRSELSYSKTNLQHYGVWTKGTSVGSKQLQAMRGSTMLINLGTQLEYYPFDIHDFENTIGSFAPYISLGMQITSYTTTATSTMGELGNPITTFSKYLAPSEGRSYGYSNESKAVTSQVLNLGTRYKLNRMSDLVFDIRAQYFNSDWVDGLNPNKDLYKENKSNDWLTFIGAGYIIYLDY